MVIYYASTSEPWEKPLKTSSSTFVVVLFGFGPSAFTGLVAVLGASVSSLMAVGAGFFSTLAGVVLAVTFGVAEIVLDFFSTGGRRFTHRPGFWFWCS